MDQECVEKEHHNQSVGNEDVEQQNPNEPTQIFTKEGGAEDMNGTNENTHGKESCQDEETSSASEIPIKGKFRRIFKNLRLRKKVNTNKKVETPQLIKAKCHKKRFASFLAFFQRRSNKVGIWNGDPNVTHTAKILQTQRKYNGMHRGAERLREYLRWKLICFGRQKLSEEDEKHILMEDQVEQVPSSVAFEVCLDVPDDNSRTSRCTTPMPCEPSSHLRRERPSLAKIDGKMIRARELRLQKHLASIRPQLARRITVVKNQIDLQLMEELRAMEQTEHINAKMKGAEESRQRQFAERIRPESARRERVQQNIKNILMMQQKQQQLKKENLENKLKMAETKKEEMAKEHKERVEKVKDHAKNVIITKLENERNGCIKRSKQHAEMKQNLADKEARRQSRIDAQMKKLKEKHGIIEERCKAKAKERSLPPLRWPNQKSDKFMIQLIEDKLIKEREEIKSRSGFQAEDEPSTGMRYISSTPHLLSEENDTTCDDDAIKDGGYGEEPWPTSF